MKILKNLFRILILTIPLCILLHSNSFAMTQEEAGKYIASYAMNFYNQRGENVQYEYNVAARAYSANTGQPWEDGIYRVECTGFVSMVIKQSIGLQSTDGGVENGSCGFVAPTKYGAYDELFEIVEDLQPR